MKDNFANIIAIGEERNMKRNNAYISAAIILAFFIGCITVGVDFPVESVPTIAKGMTTKDEVVEWFGEPYQKGLEDGQETWTYVYVKRRPGNKTESKELHISFDDGNRVDSYSYTTTSGELPAK